MNVCFTVVKHVGSVLCFKPFKIPFSVSCGLYRDNERNKKTDLSCCKIQPTEIPRFRCPLQTAPVRTEGLFWRPHGCNIAPGTDPPSEAVAEVWQRFFENFSAADFCYRQITASCTFVCRKTFRHTKGARSARPGPLPSRAPFSSYIWIPTENRPTRSPERRVINTRFGLTRSKTSALTNCSQRPDQSITAAVLSSNVSSPRSSSLSNATLRRRNLSPG